MELSGSGFVGAKKVKSLFFTDVALAEKTTDQLADESLPLELHGMSQGPVIDGVIQLSESFLQVMGPVLEDNLSPFSAGSITMCVFLASVVNAFLCSKVML